MTEVNESDTNNQDDKLNVDKILMEEVGEGKYQVQAIALFGAICFFCGLTSSDFIFIADRVKTRCKIQECEENGHPNFLAPWLANAVPVFGDAFDNCHRFAPADSWNISADSCPAALFDRSSILKCTDYVYQHQNSAVYEFDLACDEWRWFLFGGVQYFGQMISLSVTGIISDRWGRRAALAITAFNLALINIGRYWATSYNLFIFISFLGYVFGSACPYCCYILATELVVPSRRMLAVSINISCASLGSVVMGLIAWTQPYWRDLILMLYMPMLTSISYYWVGPESLRWLISKNRFEDAKTLLLKAAKMNGRALSDTTLNKLTRGAMLTRPKAGGSAATFCSVWEHKTVLLRFIIISIWLISSALMVEGLAISSVSISGNKYVNFCTVSAIAIPGFWISTLLNNKIGRKRFLCALFWMGGCCQLGYIFISGGSQSTHLALYLLSSFCSSAAHITLAVYKAELFPTSHRSRLTGFTSTLSKFGLLTSLLTPTLVISLAFRSLFSQADRVWYHLPNTIFCILAFISGALTLFTPETLGASLPATMEDAARLGKDKSNTRYQSGKKLLRKNRRDVGDVEEEVSIVA